MSYRNIFVHTEKGKQMAKKLDIIDVMFDVKNGKLKAFIHNGLFLLEDTISGERISLNEVTVPCKECKYYVWNPFGDGCWVCTKHSKYGFRPNDYCSYGEKKEA